MQETPYKTIVCLGDSITCDWKTPSYVNFLQELCDQEFDHGAVTFMNAGINGETAQDGYYRTHRDVVEKKPDLVTIMFGHNDAEPNRNISPILFANYIRKIVNYIQRYSPQSDIWLLSPNGIGDSQFEERYRPYLEQLQLAASDKKVKYVSLWDIYRTEDLENIFTDTFQSTYVRAVGKDWIHPNEKGHRIIAEKLMQVLITRTS